MGLRSKVFLYIGGILLTLFFIVYNVLSHILVNDFLALERKETEQNLLRATDALQVKIEEIGHKISDWGQWDDTFVFVQDHNQDWIDSNTQNEGLQILKINVLMVVDNSRQVVFKKYIDVSGEEQSFPVGLEEYLSLHPFLLEHTASDSEHHGLISLPEGQMIFASRAITSSDGTAPPAGTIVFAYFINEELIQDLSGVTHLDIRYFPSKIDAPQAVAEARSFITEAHPYFIPVLKETDGKAEGYSLVNTLEGAPAGLLQIEFPREIFNRGQQSLALFSYLMIFIAVLFVLIVIFVLEIFVIRRILRLNGEVEKITATGKNEGRVSLSGNDEFARLGRKINTMLEALQELELKKKESDKQFETIADAAPVMIAVLNKDMKCEYMNKFHLEFLGQKKEDRIGKGVEDIIHPEDLENESQAEFVEKLKSGNSLERELRFKYADGTYHWVLSRIMPRYDVHGDFSGFIASATDINERKGAESKQKEDLLETERMNKILVARELKMVELKNEIEALKSSQKKAK